MNRRKEIDIEGIDVSYLQKLMRYLFPKRNDCASMNDLQELVGELNHFGINTKLEARLLLKKYRRQLLDIDKTPMDAMHQRIYREDLGDEEYLDSIRMQYWFGYPALIRLALEIEFGEAYDTFAGERDGI